MYADVMHSAFEGVHVDEAKKEAGALRRAIFRLKRQQQRTSSVRCQKVATLISLLAAESDEEDDEADDADVADDADDANEEDEVEDGSPEVEDGSPQPSPVLARMVLRARIASLKEALTGGPMVISDTEDDLLKQNPITGEEEQQPQKRGAEEDNLPILGGSAAAVPVVSDARLAKRIRRMAELADIEKFVTETEKRNLPNPTMEVESQWKLERTEGPAVSQVDAVASPVVELAAAPVVELAMPFDPNKWNLIWYAQTNRYGIRLKPGFFLSEEQWPDFEARKSGNQAMQAGPLNADVVSCCFIAQAMSDSPVMKYIRFSM